MKPNPTLGILYPGEMGAALAAVLRAGGARVVTTLRGRSPQTAHRCRDAGVEILDSLADVVRQSEVVFSIVPPRAAEEVAGAYCEHAHFAPPRVVYVDVNSIGPELAASLAARVERRGAAFIDAAINGLAKNLGKSGTLYLSGRRAAEIERLFAGAVHVRLLGDEPGRASAMKMILGGLSKGVTALFAELAVLADRSGMLDEATREASRIYPGITEVALRMLPTYPAHAARRADEMRELERNANTAGLQPCVIAAVRRLHESLTASFPSPLENTDGWTPQRVIKQLLVNQIVEVPSEGGEIWPASPVPHTCTPAQVSASK
jgi:3-hydroxyisobutyrate dehydrogenase-like beta-hydroxyacid dehydrogenase